MTTVTTFAETPTAETIEEATVSTTEPSVIPMRILKVGTASSLSNSSTLGYAIGCDAAGSIYMSLRSNTAAGMFSKNWVAFLDIANALVHANRITSATLSPLYEGTSRNNAGFMLAVLRGEGLVCPFERYYQRLDFKPFLQHINSLVAAGVDFSDADAALEALDASEPLEALVASEPSDTAVDDVPEIKAPPMEILVAKRGRSSKAASQLP